MGGGLPFTLDLGENLEACALFYVLPEVRVACRCVRSVLGFCDFCLRFEK